jgi:hypothetical protein
MLGPIGVGIHVGEAMSAISDWRLEPWAET